MDHDEVYNMSRTVSNYQFGQSGLETHNLPECSGYEYQSSRYEEKDTQSKEDRITILMAKKDWRYNKDGSVDKRQSEFRELNKLANNKSYPINANGSPDKRCTKSIEVLQYKLHDLLAKKK